jgi:hypothetical protein
MGKSLSVYAHGKSSWDELSCSAVRVGNSGSLRWDEVMSLLG